MLVKTLLIALVSFIGFLECGVGNSMIQRPIVMGPLVGLVLGDVNAGLAVGATLELAFMGNVTIGAALPPEITAGGILGTALAIVSGNGTEAALALALPIATVALLIKNTFYLTARSWFLHKSDKYAAEGNAAGVDAMHMISFLSYDIVMSLVIAICFYCGSDAVQSFLAIIPAFIIRGISVAAGILPALGFAMLGKILISPKVAPYFLLGFLLAAYLNVPVLGIALLGVIIVALMLACLVTYKLRNVRFKGLAIAASLPPVLFNAVIIGIEIAVMFPDPTSSAPIWLACITNGISVGIGELISCTVLGVVLIKLIESNAALRKVFVTE